MLGASIDVYIIRPVLHIKQSLCRPVERLSPLNSDHRCVFFVFFFAPWSSSFPHLCVDVHLIYSQRAVIIHSYERHVALIQPWRLCGPFFFLLLLITAYLFVLTAVQNHVESNSDAHKRVVNNARQNSFSQLAFCIISITFTIIIKRIVIRVGTQFNCDRVA